MNKKSIIQAWFGIEGKIKPDPQALQSLYDHCEPTDVQIVEGLHKKFGNGTFTEDEGIEVIQKIWDDNFDRALQTVLEDMVALGKLDTKTNEKGETLYGFTHEVFEALRDAFEL